MPKLKAIPKSRAKTAWGLCQAVKRAILAEPKRVDMGVALERRLPQAGGPSCGTVGCFFGWSCLLAGVVIGDSPMSLFGDCDFYTVGTGSYVFNAGSGDACEDTKPGTSAHARAVVARIDKFMRVNEQVLKAHRLDGVS